MRTCMNLPYINIVCSILPEGPEVSSHLMAVLLNWLALTAAVVVTLRVKSVVMLSRGFTAVTTAEARVLASLSWAPTIVLPVLRKSIVSENKVCCHSMVAPFPKQEHNILSLVHSCMLLPGHCG